MLDVLGFALFVLLLIALLRYVQRGLPRDWRSPPAPTIDRCLTAGSPSVRVYRYYFHGRGRSMTGYRAFSINPEDAFPDRARPGPVFMLNLLKFREHATYPDGRHATGRQANDAYGRGSESVFRRVGGRIHWRGAFEILLIGPSEERWDTCFIAEYPTSQAFLEMRRDPVYREAVRHWIAAVEDARLIRLAHLEAGASFSDPA
jgi:hypothetical protein